MAIRNIIESDISGKPDAKTVAFGLGSTWYEIDLTEEEEKALEKALESYIDVGRRTTKAPAKRFVPETTPEERDKIRAWAKEQGHDLADFGKIPNRIYREYQAAHGQDE